MKLTARPTAWVLAGAGGALGLLALVASPAPGIVELRGVATAARAAGPLPGVVLGSLVLVLTVAVLRLLRQRSELRRALERVKREQERLTEQAFRDPLTKLANRELFTDRVEHALALRTREEEPVAVLFLDLDDFKNVNDSFGHAAGDELLVAAAGRIRSCVRPSDTAARLGGDEFAVLLEETDAPEGAIRTAERVLRSLHAPFLLEGREVMVRASVGIALGDSSAYDGDALLRNADVAMYRAKFEGKNRYALYAPEMHDAVLRRIDLRNGIRGTTEGDELLLA